MDLAPETTASPARRPITGIGIGNEFRAVIEGTSMERRPHARARGADQTVRHPKLPAAEAPAADHEKGTWLLAL